MDSKAKLDCSGAMEESRRLLYGRLCNVRRCENIRRIGPRWPSAACAEKLELFIVAHRSAVSLLPSKSVSPKGARTRVTPQSDAYATLLNFPLRSLPQVRETLDLLGAFYNVTRFMLDTQPRRRITMLITRVRSRQGCRTLR